MFSRTCAISPPTWRHARSHDVHDARRYARDPESSTRRAVTRRPASLLSQTTTASRSSTRRSSGASSSRAPPSSSKRFPCGPRSLHAPSNDRCAMRSRIVRAEEGLVFIGLRIQRGAGCSLDGAGGSDPADINTVAFSASAYNGDRSRVDAAGGDEAGPSTPMRPLRHRGGFCLFPLRFRARRPRRRASTRAPRRPPFLCSNRAPPRRRLLPPRMPPSPSAIASTPGSLASSSGSHAARSSRGPRSSAPFSRRRRSLPASSPTTGSSASRSGTSP